MKTAEEWMKLRLEEKLSSTEWIKLIQLEAWVEAIKQSADIVTDNIILNQPTEKVVARLLDLMKNPPL